MEGIPLRLLFTLFCFIFIFINFSSKIFAEEANIEYEPSLINSYEEDVTGDGFREYIRLHGNLLSHNSLFYPDIWLDITSPFSQHWKISLRAGYDPDIQFIDLTRDQVFDIFYAVSKDMNKTQHEYQLYSLENGTIKQIQLPKHQFIKTKLIDDFRVEIKLHPHQKPLIINLPNKNDYIKDEIYEEDGKLLNEKKLHHKSIHYIEPILINEQNGYGLKTYQQIKDMYNHLIGEIQTVWYYKNDEWVILTTNWFDRSTFTNKGQSPQKLSKAFINKNFEGVSFPRSFSFLLICYDIY